MPGLPLVGLANIDDGGVPSSHDLGDLRRREIHDEEARRSPIAKRKGSDPLSARHVGGQTVVPKGV
jgi:hypothetical protein